MYKGYTAGYHPASLIPAEINQLRLGNKTVTRSVVGKEQASMPILKQYETDKLLLWAWH